MPKHFAAILGHALAAKYLDDGHGAGDGTTLWHELDVAEDDVTAVKSGASAFFPGKCDLKAQRDRRGIDTVLISNQGFFRSSSRLHLPTTRTMAPWATGSIE